MPESPLRAYLGYLRDCVRAQQRRSSFENIFRIKNVKTLPLTSEHFKALQVQEELEDVRQGAHEMAVALELQGPLELTSSLGLVYLVGRCELTRRREDDDEEEETPTEGGPGRRSTPLCAPLFTVPLMFERRDESAFILPEETSFTLNIGLIAKLSDIDDEDLLHFHLADLLDRVPQWPLSNEGLADFLRHLMKAFPNFPGVQPSLFSKDLGFQDVDLEEVAGARNQTPRILMTAAIFTHPPTPSLSVMGELEELAGRASLGESILGRAIREVGVAPTHEAGEDQEHGPASDDEPSVAKESLAPMDLSDMQRKILQSASDTDLTVVTGPPGTGKSYCITALILDQVQKGKTVLMASHKAQAVDIVVKNIRKYGSHDLVAVSGNRALQRDLARRLDNLTDKDADGFFVSPRDMTSAELHVKRKSATLLQAAENARHLASLMGLYANRAEEAKRLDPVAAVVVRNRHMKLKQAIRGGDLLKYGRALESSGGGSWLRKFRGRRYVNHVRESLKAPVETTYQDLHSGLKWVQSQRELEKITEQILPRPGLDEAWKSLEVAQEDLRQAKQDLLNLRRKKDLYHLLRDEARGQLRAFIGALRAADGNVRRKKEFLNRVDPKALLRAFPVWACTNPHVSSVLPLEAGLFDLVVIDEASQCDLASAVPVMYRGKSVVIVGDPHQLTPVIFLNAKQEMAAFANNNVSPGMKITHRYSQRSLFEVANDVASGRHKHMLDEHYRCVPPIIQFSNQEFYDNALRIMTARPATRFEDAISVHRVRGQREEDSTVNPTEVEYVTGLLNRLAEEAGDDPPSIGILSPFRDHVEALNRSVAAKCTNRVRDVHSLVVGTAHALQGDERDVIILSTSLDPDFAHGTLRFLENPNLLNVAITRARKHLHIVTSIRAEDLPDGLMKRFLLYAEQRLDARVPDGDSFDSHFEEEVCFELRDAGYTVFTQFRACGYWIDLVVTDGTAAVGVECDGPTHFREDGSYSEDDVVRHVILRRAGWQLVRIPYFDWHRRKHKRFIDEIRESLVGERMRIDQLRGKQDASKDNPQNPPQESSGGPKTKSRSQSDESLFLGHSAEVDTGTWVRFHFWLREKADFRPEDKVKVLNVVNALRNGVTPNPSHEQRAMQLLREAKLKGFNPASS